MADLFGGRREKARLAAQHFSSSRIKRMRTTQDHNFVKNNSQEKQQVQFLLFQKAQLVISTLIQPQSLVQLVWQQSPFHTMGTSAVGLEGQWNMSTPQSLVSPSFFEQQLPQGVFNRNSVNSPQLQFNERFRSSSGNACANGKLGSREIVCFLCEGKGHYAND
ncbi:17441_t:CDS:1, partial [Cetraspora pellucida]